MGVVCRFDQESQLHESVPGCPLARLPMADDEAACARCAANAGWPGEPTIGCRVSIPAAIWQDAVAQLETAAPDLSAAVMAHANTLVPPTPEALTAVHALLERWVALDGIGVEGREVASVAAAFVAAAKRTGRGVWLWS